MHPHLYELDAVNLDIQQNHRVALQDEHCRILRAERSGRIAAMAMTLRASIAAMLIATGEHLRHEPVPSSKPAPHLEGVGESADATGAA